MKTNINKFQKEIMNILHDLHSNMTTLEVAKKYKISSEIVLLLRRKEESGDLSQIIFNT